ncbi:hypothetical protein [Francisella-like endosymbiont]
MQDRSKSEETLDNINDKLAKISVGGDVSAKIAQNKMLEVHQGLMS